MPGQRANAEPVDDTLLDAAVAVIEEFGYAGLTLERLATAAGISRMTLHRRGTTLRAVVDGVSLRAAAEYQAALFPVLSSTADAATRLRQALDATCDLADRHLPLLAGLFADGDGVFHADPDPSGALPTDQVFVAPFVRLLVDGARDGTLRAQDDPGETATVLFNTVGWGYVQLRHAQRWPAARARAGVIALATSALVVDGTDQVPDTARP